jgi:neutral ceramidase
VETPRRAGFGWDASLGNYLQAAKDEAGTIRLPVRFLIINDDIALWSAPVELFCEISICIRDRSPFPHTFYFGYANGWLGYLPTRQAYHEGGYETVTNPFTEQVEDDFTNNVLSYLQGHVR